MRDERSIIPASMLESCKERSYSNGHRTGRDPGLPESCWGTFMPGDEPGHICAISGQFCEEGCVSFGDCPREDWPEEEE